MFNRKVITLLPLFLVIIIDTMGFGLIVPVLSPLFMAKDGGILPATTSVAVRDFLFGLSLAGFTATMLLGAPFLGDLSDYIGRKKVLIISLLGTAVSLAISGLGIIIHSVTLILVGRCCAGFAAGSQPIAQAVIADISSEKNKAIYMGLLGFASCLGFIIGPIIGGYFSNPNLVSWFNYSTPFFLAACFAFLNAVSVLVTFKETYFPKTKAKLQLLKGLMVFISAFTHKNIRRLATVFLLYQTGFAVYLTFVSIFIVQAFHYSTIGVGHFMTYFGIVLAFAYLVMVPIAVKFLNLETAVKISLLIAGLGMVTLFWPTELIIWLSLIPIGICNGLTFTSMLTILSNSVDPDSQGWIMGVTSSVVAAAWGIGALLAGALGSLHVFLPFIISIIFTFMALGLFLSRRSSRNPPS
jgi:MFS family permease